MAYKELYNFYIVISSCFVALKYTHIYPGVLHVMCQNQNLSVSVFSFLFHNTANCYELMYPLGHNIIFAFQNCSINTTNRVSVSQITSNYN